MILKKGKVNFFLVAAPRSGSTQLAHWISQLRGVCVPSIKEPNFFSNSEFPEWYVAENHLNDVEPSHYVKGGMKKKYQFAIFRNEVEYEALYSGFSQHCEYLLDASTTYLHHKNAANKINVYNPQAKIILLLRSPVKRLISHYQLNLRIGRTRKSLDDEIRSELFGKNRLVCENYLLRQSLYSEAVGEFYKVFPKSNVLTLFFEEVTSDPGAALKKISDFIGVDYSGVELSASEKNQSLSPRFEWLNYVLNKSGIKGSFRRLLPIGVKRKIKTFYFKKPEDVVRYEIPDFCLTEIERDIEALSSICEKIPADWGSDLERFKWAK